MSDTTLPHNVVYRPAKGLYEARWTFDGKRYACTSKDLRTAVTKRDQAIARQEAGKAHAQSRIKVAAFYEHWLVEVLPTATSRRGKPLTEGTKNVYASALNSWMIPALGQKPLVSLVEADIKRMYDRMVTAGKSSSYLSTVQKSLVRFLRDAKAAGHIERDKLVELADVPAPYGTPTRERVVPTAPQLWELLNCASGGESPDHLLRAFIAMAGLLGLRITEATGARWEDYDTDTATLTVTGKGGKERTLKVGKILASELERWRREQLRMRMASPWWSDEGFLLSTTAGTRMDDANLRKRFARVAETVVPGATPHSLRHAYTTMLFEAAEDIEVIAKVLGHSSSDVTKKVYVHVRDEVAARVADTADAAMLAAQHG